MREGLVAEPGRKLGLDSRVNCCTPEVLLGVAGCKTFKTAGAQRVDKSDDSTPEFFCIHIHILPRVGQAPSGDVYFAALPLDRVVEAAYPCSMQLGKDYSAADVVRDFEFFWKPSTSVNGLSYFELTEDDVVYAALDWASQGRDDLTSRYGIEYESTDVGDIAVSKLPMNLVGHWLEYAGHVWQSELIDIDPVYAGYIL